MMFYAPTTYDYTAGNELTMVTDNDGKTVQYEYGSDTDPNWAESRYILPFGTVVHEPFAHP